MSEDRRRYLREMLDELDRYFDEFEKSVGDAIKTSINTGQKVFSRPVVAGMAMGVGPEGKPSIQFFGDNLIGPDGFRAPIYEQIVDDTGGSLHVLVELPGVEKDDVQISALDDTVSLQAERGERRYRVEVRLQREIDAESGAASYKNGLLEISFKIKDKTNKGYRRVTIV